MNRNHLAVLFLSFELYLVSYKPKTPLYIAMPLQKQIFIFPEFANLL